jgi:hypothetical protein
MGELLVFLMPFVVPVIAYRLAVRFGWWGCEKND